uniref:Uncharacterized protein n=1 Tax=Sphaerodactylus townsendi TaxID=933632 RepID=A0ACB8GEI2_9SAUR
MVPAVQRSYLGAAQHLRVPASGNAYICQKMSQNPVADQWKAEQNMQAAWSLECSPVMVLNRDGNKVFPQRSRGIFFSAATESNANLEERENIPGLSEDIFQFLLKQNVTK